MLHDVFSVPFPEIAEVVGRSPAAVRQLASRARGQVEGGRPRTPVTKAEQRELVEAFVAACRDGDLPALFALLDPDVVLRGDGGEVSVIAFTVDGGLITAIDFVRNPDKLAKVPGDRGPRRG